MERWQVSRPEEFADGLTMEVPAGAARRRLAGDEGVWFFITADIAMFAVLFTAFMLARMDAPLVFEHSRRQLDPAIGTFNTFVLLTSSWLVALAVHAARKGQRVLVRRCLLAGMAVGACFALSKTVEYSSKIGAGLTLLSDDFFMYYYALTGLHFLHFVVGMAVLAVCWSKARRDALDARYLVWLESSGCYWHMVDLLWIVLFPLLYLMRLPGNAAT